MENLPNVEFCIDGYHVMTWAIDAMEELRKQIWHQAKKEESSKPRRKKGRPHKGKKIEKNKSKKYAKTYKYTLGKNPENLTEKQVSCLDEIKELYPKLFKGYQLKESLRKVFQSIGKQVEINLDAWLSWARRSRLDPFVELSKKIRRHREAIIATVKHELSNARLESMNNTIKVTIRSAYGFKNIQNLIDVIMIRCSNLKDKIWLAYGYR